MEEAKASITDPAQRENSRANAIADLLKLFSASMSRQEYLDAVVQRIQKWSGCQHVGIRIRDRLNNIPFEAHTGYDNTFMDLEGTMCLDDTTCICPRVMLGQPDPEEKENISPEGSFFSENSITLVGGFSETRLKRYRGVCPQRGYATLVVSPVKYRGDILGVIHLACPQKGVQ